MRILPRFDNPLFDTAALLMPPFDLFAFTPGPYCSCFGQTYFSGNNQSLGSIYVAGQPSSITVQASNLLFAGEVYTPGQGFGQIANDCVCDN